MGAPQFGRGIENQSFAENVEVDVKQNDANQFDDDVTGTDISGYDSGEQNISGAQEVTVAVSENSGTDDASLTLEWTDGTGTVVYTETPSSVQNLSGSQDYANVIVKSTHVQIKGSGTSNNSDVTANAH